MNVEGSQMSRSPRSAENPSALRRSPGAVALLIAAIAGLAVAAVAGLAVAKTSSHTLQTAHNSTVNQTIVVDSRGFTLYELRPETSHHLLCTSSQCLQFWPPLKVSKNAKLTKATGIKGKLGKLHRAGFYQVTLDGRPLYHFSIDKKKGAAAGQGIVSFGGTWHVVKASAASKGGSTTTGSSTSTSTTSTTTSSCLYPPCY
jgi:predicted lipoprotein with Yx(FWY)xxD motif